MPRTRAAAAVIEDAEEATSAVAPRARTRAPAPKAAAPKPAPQPAAKAAAPKVAAAKPVPKQAPLPSLKRAAPAADRMPEHVSSEDLRESAQREPEHEPVRVRTRRKKNTQVEDEFYVPVEEIPDGLDYNWKRWTVNGKEDPFYIAKMREQGWEPVPPSRHPNWVPPGFNEPYIIKSGMILMDRPIELTNEAVAENKQLARQQVREAEQRLGKTPKDTMTRDFPGVEPRITKEIGRMVPLTVEE